MNNCLGSAFPVEPTPYFASALLFLDSAFTSSYCSPVHQLHSYPVLGQHPAQALAPSFLLVWGDYFGQLPFLSSLLRQLSSSTASSPLMLTFDRLLHSVSIC